MKIFTKNKEKLLRLFFTHPKEQFYIQQIGRLLGKKPGVFQRTLDNLQKEGILLSEYKANAKFFRVNKKYPIYSELKSIIFKSVKITLLPLIFTFIFYSYRLYAQEADSKTDLSLSDAINISFGNNKDIQIQEKEIDAAKASILDATSRFLPNLDFQGSYTHNDKVLAQNIFTGFPNDNKVGLSLTESVYNGGANIANFKQSKVNLKIQEETLRAKKLDVEFEAKRLYYGLLLAYETERIAQEFLGQSKAHYEDVKQRFEQGTSSRFDLLQSKVKVSLLVPEVVRAQNSIQLIKAELNKLLNRSVNTSVSVKEKMEYALIEIKEDEFLKEAYLNKPEMNLRILGVDLSKWAINIAKSGYRPQINFQADYNYRSDNLANIINEKYKNWNAGIAVSIPIFDGFSSKAKVDAAKARYAQANLAKEDLHDQIAVDIRQACLDLEEAATIINAVKDNIEEAREALRISEISYDNGVGTNLDVLDAQVSLGQIQQDLAGGIYDYLMAGAYLDRTTGNNYIKEAKNEEKN